MIISWSPAALVAFDEQLAARRSALLASGADPDEVAADLRAHLEAEARAEGRSMIEETTVHAAFEKMASAIEAASPHTQVTPQPALGGPGGFGWFMLSFFGVVLGAMALIWELVDPTLVEFINPIPTWGHVLAVAFVVLSNATGILWCMRQGTSGLKLVGRLNAVASGLALGFTLLLVPVMPIALIGLIVFGLGLLPMAPLFSLLAAWRIRSHIRKRAQQRSLGQLPRVWLGLLAGLALFGLLEGQLALRSWAEVELCRDYATTPAWMRALVSREALASRALRDSTEGIRLSSRDVRYQHWAGHVTPEQAKVAFYRRYGVLPAFSDLPKQGASLLGGRRSDLDLWQWDPTRGEQRVGEVQAGLHLVESRIDASLDADALVGYAEWIMVFRNDHHWEPAEARAILRLPAGGAVSRLTLWVNGEEREAAFAGRGQVVAAYKEIVQVQRRDPVLVTQAAPDEVLMQCFPVPAEGGSMQIRVGVSFPLHATAGATAARWVLPRLMERNFTSHESLQHHVWIESRHPFVSQGRLLAEAAPEGAHALRGAVAENDWPSLTARPPEVRRDATRERAWSPAPPDARGYVVQFLEKGASSGPLAYVLDAGARVTEHHAAAARAWAAGTLPPATSGVWLAGDEAVRLSPAEAGDPRTWRGGRRDVGGHDSTEALLAAAEALAKEGGGTLVWLHGAQPITWQETGRLEQFFKRRGDTVRVVAIPLVEGGNALRARLGELTNLETLDLIGSVEEGLSFLGRYLRGDERRAVRRHQQNAPDQAWAGLVTSAHLARLWAYDQIRAIHRKDRAAALELAQTHHLVSPVSGAVVLETKAQFDAAGLNPVDRGSVPSIPEPGVVALMVVAAGVFGVLVKLERDRRRKHS